MEIRNIEDLKNYFDGDDRIFLEIKIVSYGKPNERLNQDIFNQRFKIDKGLFISEYNHSSSAVEEHKGYKTEFRISQCIK